MTDAGFLRRISRHATFLVSFALGSSFGTPGFTPTDSRSQEEREEECRIVRVTRTEPGVGSFM